jgi:hypothetical protein
MIVFLSSFEGCDGLSEVWQKRQRSAGKSGEETFSERR